MTALANIVAVVILYGGQWPFILRPRGDFHEMVGVSYIYGMMDGSFLRQYNPSGENDKTFRLR